MFLIQERHAEDTGWDERPVLLRAPTENLVVSGLECLCEDCKAVDWDQISKLAANNALEREVKIQHTSTNTSHAELRRSSCQVCRLLSVIKPASFDTKKFVLVATSMSRFIGMTSRDSRGLRPQCTVIGFLVRPVYDDSFDINKTGCLAVLGSDLDTLEIKPNTIKPDSIDYKLFQRLMTLCDEIHEGPCKVHFDPIDIGLRVIDIWAKKVVRAPHRCRYVALSYVWGSAGDVASNDDLSLAPLVVQDAISVTASMGCQYLWVDRYCIPQNNSEKHRMISNMDKIYSSAFFTIVAAAGNDARYGLPGVSQFQRQSPKTLRLGEEIRLQQVYPHPVNLLEATPWASRGWTYQEGFLSRWRLIFTKEQVLFLCNSMYFAESVTIPMEVDDLKLLHASKFKHLIGSFGDTGRRHDETDGLRDQIREYSGRTLRYDTDSLSAFSGVLSYHNSTAAEIYPILHVWGVPVVVDKNFPIFWERPDEPTFEFHMFWMHEKPARRRDGFPSWSWTGWAGLVCFPDWSIRFSLEPLSKGTVRERNSKIDAQFYVQGTSEEDSNPEKIILAELFKNLTLSTQSNHQIDQNTYRRLFVFCLVRPLRFVDVELRGAQAKSGTLVRFPDKTNSETAHSYDLSGWEVPRSSGGYAIFRFQKNIHVGAKVSWDEVCDENAVSCLLLYHSQYSDTDVTSAFLLVKQVDDGQYQRVGLVLVNLQLPLGHEDTIFMDEDGKVLDEVVVSGFAETPLLSDGERRNICLI